MEKVYIGYACVSTEGQYDAQQLEPLRTFSEKISMEKISKTFIDNSSTIMRAGK